MKREPGYYWVKYGGDWIIARYCVVGYWMSPDFNDKMYHEDSDFEQIDERRIERQQTRLSQEEIAKKTEALRISQSMGDRINDVDDFVTDKK